MSVCTCARLYALIIPIKRTTPRSGCSIMSVRISARRAFCRHIMFPLLKHITCVARYPMYIQRNERNADRVDRSRVSLTPSMSRARARAAISFSISVDLPGLIDNHTTDTPDARCDNSQAHEEPSFVLWNRSTTLSTVDSLDHARRMEFSRVCEFNEVFCTKIMHQ